MVIPLLIAVTLHEVAHGYAALKMGDPTAKLAGRLTLNPIKHIDPFGSVVLPLLLKLSGSSFIFGYAKPVPVNFNRLTNYRKGTFFVASAGVFANALLAVISSVVLKAVIYLHPAWQGSILQTPVAFLYHMLIFSVVINCILAIFNLIPIPPLDGSRLLALVLPPAWQLSYERFGRYGMVLLLLLLVTGSLGRLLDFFLTPLVNLLLN
jgi:Zn-dependent protease